jgi:hypothetical protein
MRRRPASRAATAIAIVALAGLAVAACALGISAKPKAAGSRPLNDGEEIGKVQRSAGGTAAIEGVRTLLALTCREKQLIVTTNKESITAGMDCQQQPPQAALDRFLGRPVAVTYAGGRLRIENPSAGTLELPAADASITETHATP